MYRLTIVLFLFLIFNKIVYAENIGIQDQFNFILTACGGSNSAKENQTISSNLATLLEKDINGNYEKSSDKHGLEMLFSGIQDEDKKIEAMKFFPECIENMMGNMKDFLSPEQKETLGRVLKITKNKNDNFQSNIVVYVPKKINEKEALSLFTSVECHDISTLERVSTAIISDGTKYCDSKGVMVLSFSMASSSLVARTSGAVKIDRDHYFRDLKAKKIIFKSGKVRYFQLPYAVKKTEDGLRTVQMNFVPKP